MLIFVQTSASPIVYLLYLVPVIPKLPPHKFTVTYKWNSRQGPFGAI